MRIILFTLVVSTLINTLFLAYISFSLFPYHITLFNYPL